MSRIGVHKLNLKQIAIFGAAGIVLGLIYISLINGFSKFYPFVNGATTGLLLGVLISVFEIYIFHPRLKRNSFAWMLLIRAIIYTLSIVAIILVIVTITRSIRHNQSFIEALQSKESIEYITHGNFKTAVFFTFIVALVGNFIRLISLKVGRGTLTDFFLGAYHKPKLTERVFVFIQIKNAQQLLEDSPIETYHQFLNEIYGEISMAAMHNRGFVYEYVDDQVLLYWKAKKKKMGLSLINCYKDVLNALERKEAHFKKTYNVVPEFYWAAHGGDVIQAEIGELKTEIVFHGDVLNTTARIASEGIERSKSFVVSNYLLDKIESTGITATTMGEIQLRGKSMPLSLYAIDK